jgi:type III secretion protein L
MAILIDRPGYRIATDSRVVKRADALIVAEVTRAYALAQEQIQSAFQAVEADCERIAAEAYEKGLSDAKREAARRWAITELDRKALVDSLRPALAEVVVDAVALIARSIDREATLARALELLQGSLREVSWARMRVHPDATSVAQRALDEMCRETGIGRIARVLADSSLSPDGCVLESELGTVDASLDTQLNAIREAVTSAAHNIASTSEP